MEIILDDIINLLKIMDKLTLIFVLILVVIELVNRKMKKNIKTSCPHEKVETCDCIDKFI